MLSDPLRWSLPLGRVFGINIRVHLLFPLVALGMILRAWVQKIPDNQPHFEGEWKDMAMVIALLFFSVLLHEFGHCFAARRVDGEASDVLLWPLGGLAYVELPHNPRAHFLTAAAGPLVNIGLCVVCAAILFSGALGEVYWPPLYPFGYPGRIDGDGTIQMHVWGSLFGGMNNVPNQGLGTVAIVVGRLFWVNWFLALVNLVLVGYPMDSGRMLQAALWRFFGYRTATLVAVFVGFVVMFIVLLYAVIVGEVLAFGLAIFIYVACKQEWIVLETGGEEGVFGYDFSQGYTSLERDEPVTAAPQPKRKLNWWQRWQQRRNARKMQREQEDRAAEERRMDELLEKVQREGMNALSDEEKRFLKRVSDRYRNRQ
jgi:stage IV sporulation protein FB